MTDDVVVRVEGHAGFISLNRPSALNALTLPMVHAMTQALLAWRDDGAVTCVVIDHADGRGFCAGGDIRFLYDSYQNGTANYQRYFADEYHMLKSLRQYAKPVLVFLDGYVLGGGFGLVCCADHVVATARSVLGTPEVTLGLPPAQIAPFVWQRLGESAARQCLLQGLSYTAAQAQQVGLVNELIDEESDAAWGKTLTRLMRAAPGAVASTKQLLRSVRGPVPDMRDAAAQAFASGLRSAEAAQGLAAFARRQPAPWTLSDKDKA